MQQLTLSTECSLCVAAAELFLSLLLHVQLSVIALLTDYMSACVTLCFHVVLLILCTFPTSNFFRFRTWIPGLVTFPSAAVHTRYRM